MGQEIYTDNTGQRVVRTTKSDADIAGAEDTARMGSTAGAGLGAMEKNAGTAKKPGAKPMPKQSDYPDLGSYGEAMRQWRNTQDSSTDAQAQKKALGSM